MYNKINVVRRKELRKCLNCGKEWEVVVKKKNPSDRILHICKDCCKILTVYQRKKLRIDNDSSYRELYLERKRESHRKNIVHNMWKRARDRAIKNNIDFNIEESDIKIPKICPILEVPIYCGTKGNYEYSPSLDRIDNTKGYIKGNIQVISKKANSMKNSASLDELKTFCKNILRYSLNNREYESIDLQDKEPVG